VAVFFHSTAIQTCPKQTLRIPLPDERRVAGRTGDKAET